MSNNQMVSVPRELLERCKQFTFDIRSPQAIRSDIDVVLTKPAEQHQGEPVSYQKPSDYWAGFGYTDRSCHIELRKMVDHLESFLDAIPDGPLYTHPAPAEVERLRAELEVAEKLYEEGCQASYDFDAMQQQIDDLLRMLRMAWGSDDISAEDCRRIDAALSASAEPEVTS